MVVGLEHFVTRKIMRLGLACSAGLLLLSIGGCSGIKSYQDRGEKNAIIQIKADSGHFFSRRRADLDVHRVNAACEATYLGSRRLETGDLELGLPVGERLLLVFVFQRSSALGGKVSSSAVEMMVTPEPGHRYEFEAYYRNNRYGAMGLAIAPGGKRQEIEHQRLKDCVAS